jgi:hypothetical protein
MPSTMRIRERKSITRWTLKSHEKIKRKLIEKYPGARTRKACLLGKVLRLQFDRMSLPVDPRAAGPL